MLDQKYFEEMEAKIPKGKVRTRFAPSPTGYMHVGNLRTALYTWLIARNAGGTFILRIEDTDQGRLVEGATDVIYRTLAECGLDHDEGPDVGGPVAPYIQSQRRDTYGKYAKLLAEKSHAYYCFCEKCESEEDSGDFARAADPCRDLPLDEALARVEAGEPYVIRQKIPQEGSTTFHDAIFGDITVENKTLDDQVLLKRDGLPTYNFANVIDDHLMGITHVVRGSEYLSSAPKYNLLYEAFGWDIPTYVHCSPVMRDAQHKMSKRHGDPSYEDLRNQGFLTNAILNYVALLGWSPRGELAEQVSRGLIDCPVVFRSHGGRASAIRSGDLHIDVAFLGAPSCDPYGNANGYSRDGEDGIACGSLGYARTDAEYADQVVVITNHLVPYPNAPWAIPEHDVDYVVVTDDIGDPKGIMSGATRYTKDPKELLIAKTAANVIEAAGYLYDGFSMQMGSGGASLATARFLRQKMLDRGIHCRFALGGITGQITAMHEEGLIDRILDVQSFDLDAAKSLKNNHFHHQIGATYYASYLVDSAVDQLDFVVLSALEIDTDFNVNVLTGSDGVIRGAIGGHPDTAEGASLSVVVAPLTRGRIPTIVKHVNTVVTPGDAVDVVVTDQGIAVNPRRPDVKQKLEKAGLHVFTIEQLQQRAEKIVGVPEPIRYKDRVVGVVMYRDNTIIDVIRQIDEDA